MQVTKARKPVCPPSDTANTAPAVLQMEHRGNHTFRWSLSGDGHIPFFPAIGCPQILGTFAERLPALLHVVQGSEPVQNICSACLWITSVTLDQWFRVLITEW